MLVLWEEKKVLKRRVRARNSAELLCQRLRNHYEIQQMAFSSGKICGFSTLGVADICRKSCDLRSNMQIPPTREWRKLSQNPVAVFSCSG